MVFSDSIISDAEADFLTLHASSSSSHAGSPGNVDHVDTAAKDILSHADSNGGNYHATHGPKETYESMLLDGKRYLCSIPIIDTPARNETSEAEAKEQEEKEVARATTRGWELLQDLGNGHCLYLIPGYWSYSFCFNAEITQFHQLPNVQGRMVIDPNAPTFVLGKTAPKVQEGEDEWGNGIVHRSQKNVSPAPGELQTKGDTRYLVQKLDGGTVCDLTGRPRRVEVQYHCNMQVSGDRIGWIKEVTTCSYLMVVWTQKLCNDVAFVPPKEVEANTIACRMVVPEQDMGHWNEMKTLEAQKEMTGTKETGTKDNSPLVIGGIVVGGLTSLDNNGQKLEIPSSTAPTPKVVSPEDVDIIVRSKGTKKGGEVEYLNDEELEKLELNPELLDRMVRDMQRSAGDRGWKLQVVDTPGEDTREVQGIVDQEENDEEGVSESSGTESEKRDDEGSEETYKDES